MIKSVGCLPRSAHLQSLAWRLESVLKKDQIDHIVHMTLEGVLSLYDL